MAVSVHILTCVRNVLDKWRAEVHGSKSRSTKRGAKGLKTCNKWPALNEVYLLFSCHNKHVSATQPSLWTQEFLLRWLVFHFLSRMWRQGKSGLCTFLLLVCVFCIRLYINPLWRISSKMKVESIKKLVAAHYQPSHHSEDSSTPFPQLMLGGIRCVLSTKKHLIVWQEK